MSFDPAWEAQHAARVWGTWPSEHLVRFMTRNFPNPVRVLDLGCGAGGQTVFLASQGHQVIAVDGSPSAIDRARATVGSRLGTTVPHTIVFSIADVTDLAVAAESTDCVVDIACLQHLDLAAATAVAHRALAWLKPGGWFFSLMASFASDSDLVSPGGVSVRREFPAGIEAIFAGYRTTIGHERIDRPGGGTIGNWIIEAQKPA